MKKEEFVAGMKTLLGLCAALASMVVPVAAQAPRHEYREISSRDADKLKLLSCTKLSDGTGAGWVVFGQADHVAAFHEGSFDDGRMTGTTAAVVASTTVTWKEPGVPPGATEESFSLNLNTGLLDATLTYPAPTRRISLFCHQARIVTPEPGHPGIYELEYDANPASLCDSEFPNGVHSSTPIRVYVVKIHLGEDPNKDHPNGFDVNNIPLNKSATAAFVSAVTLEALEQRSDTKFVAADGPGDANLYANLEIVKDHTGYQGNIDIGGLGITGPNFGLDTYFPGQLRILRSIDGGDASTSGGASRLVFAEAAKYIVRGWTCESGGD